MAVGADERVGVVDGVAVVLLLVDAAREVLEVHLVDDADAGRHDLERVERLHAPLHELVALVVALELQLHVQVERVLLAEVIDLHRVVDDEIDRHERLDLLRVLARALRDAAHGRDVGEQRHAREVLQHDARHDERDLVDALRIRLPVRELLDVLFGDLLAVVVAQHGLEHDADRHGQPLDLRLQFLAELRQRVELAFAGTAVEFLECFVEIVGHGDFLGLRLGKNSVFDG